MVHPRLAEAVKLLVVAAESRELRGILGQARRRHWARIGTGWARSASLGADELLLVANGAGAVRAAAAVDCASAAFRPSAIINVGFCGALDQSLCVASVVVASEVIGANGRFPALAPRVSLPHQRGVVVTIDRIAQSAGEKRSLREAGSMVVDMEAAAVAERAARLGVPFYCIKSVTDLAYESLAIDLNAALRPDGHFDTIGILGTILGRPLARLPELIRLWNRSIRARCALGTFIADCRF